MEITPLEETRSYSYVKPWRRYFAKTIDLSIFSNLTGTAIGIVIGILQPNLLEESSMAWIAVSVVAVVFASPLEALCLSRYKTSFGKFLMSTEVVGADGSAISFLQALRRTLKSYAVGLAFAIPFLSLLTLLAGFNRLENNGVTWWDETENTYVVHNDMKWWGWCVGIGLIILILGHRIYSELPSQ